MSILDLYLGGETPTLIRYNIIFTKRDFEANFYERHWFRLMSDFARAILLDVTAM